MQPVLAVVLAALLGVSGITLRLEDNGTDNSRARALIEQARAALGGEAKLKAVESLSATASFRQIPEAEAPEVDGEVELSFLLPDKFMKTEVSSIGGGIAELTRITGFNGDQLFTDARSTGSGRVMVRTPGVDNPQAQANQLRQARAEAARYLIAWLLTAPEKSSVEFSYAGEAEADNTTADILEARGPEGFNAQLFIDKKTHRPLMLSYRAVVPRMVMRTRQGTQASRDELERGAREPQAAAPPPQESDVHLYFSDYRDVDGIMLPHRITRSVDGRTSEEWEMKRYKINPPLKAEQFKK